MYKKNDELKLNITDLSVDGHGIGKHNDAVFFCHGALPSEVVNAKIIKVAKRYNVARVLSIVTPSKSRTTPPCPVFNRCGGCTLQHLAYQAQTEFKQARVQDALSRIGGIDVSVNPCQASPQSYDYRNKAVLPIAQKDGKTSIGFYAKGSHAVVPIDTCAIQHPLINQALKIVTTWLNHYPISVYDENTGSGLVRSLFARVTSTNQLMVALVTTLPTIPHLDELVTTLQTIDTLASVLLNVNNTKGNALLSAENVLVWGKDALTHTLDGLDFSVSLNAFLQVNTPQTDALYTKALDYAAIKPTDTVVDLYCGIGTITLLAAKRAGQVYGIESVKAATDNAKQNAAQNSITNAQFICGDCTDAFSKLTKKVDSIDVLIADPPRKGLDAALIAGIIKAKPARMVYASCDPGSLARDLKALSEAYSIEDITPYDMFPQTTHAETVVCLKRI